MARFARVQDGVVREVIVVSNDDAPTEAAGQAFIASIGLDGEWIQTSYYNNPVGEPPTVRGKYAGPGDLWDGETFRSPEAQDA